MHRPEVVTLGETMGLVAATGTGPFTVGMPTRMSFGGAETNVAIGLCRLGHRASWIGRLGTDAVGAMVHDTLRGEGVGVEGVRLEPELPTGLMLREHRTTDRVRVSYYRRGLAGSRLAPADVDTELVAGARILHVSGITPAISDTAGAAVEAAVAAARQAGALVSFDVNYRAALWSVADAGAALRALARNADVVFAGLDEAQLLTGEPSSATPEQVARELDAHVGGGGTEVVLKLGADGALALVKGGVETAPAAPVSSIDPVGAGDAFVAGYLSGMLDGVDTGVRLRRASVCGGFAVSVSGDWEGLPRRSELAMLDGVENVTR